MKVKVTLRVSKTVHDYVEADNPVQAREMAIDKQLDQGYNERDITFLCMEKVDEIPLLY